MKKFSRMHGWMWLKTYASGDGSISFVWVKDSDRIQTVGESVTESDVSEFLRIPENEKRWEGWDILDLGMDDRVYQIRLARNVERPFHTSLKLFMDGVTYSYAYDQRLAESMGIGFRHNGELTGFWRVTDVEREPGLKSLEKVVNLDVISSLCFFLNNEECFCRRRRANHG